MAPELLAQTPCPGSGAGAGLLCNSSYPAGKQAHQGARCKSKRGQRGVESSTATSCSGFLGRNALAAQLLLLPHFAAARSASKRANLLRQRIYFFYPIFGCDVAVPSNEGMMANVPHETKRCKHSIRRFITFAFVLCMLRQHFIRYATGDEIPFSEQCMSEDHFNSLLLWSIPWL